MSNQQIHLSIDCRRINDSGIGTYLKNILPGVIASNKFQVTVLGYKDEIEKFIWFNAVSFISLKSKPISIAEQFELPLKIPKCDVYWAPNINVSIFPIKARNRVTTIHDVYHLAHSASFSKVKVIAIKTLVAAAIYYSKYIITVSEFSKNEIIKYTNCSSAKIKVFHLAVAESFNKGYAYKKISEPYFLAVGNIKPHKNLINALEAFKRINNENLKFFIVGKRDGFITGDTNIDQLVDSLGDRVRFTGYVDIEELKNYYANAKAFIFPSKYEGFGLPVLEALKFNIPVVASNAAAIPEVGGDAIIYFNPNKVSDIAEKMNIVLDRDFKINKRNYELQLSRFNWNKTVESHISLFTSV